MAFIASIIGAVSILVLYNTAYEIKKKDLIQMVKSQARLIEAIARFDQKYSTFSIPGGSNAATLSQIHDAMSAYKGFGETGEFVLGRQEGRNIVFLLQQSHLPLDSQNQAANKKNKTVSLISNLAEPMRRVLSGQSGAVIGLDYRGEKVLAAYEPVSHLNIGIVAKIDISEIRAPFLKAATLISGVGVVIIIAGLFLFFLVSNPLTRKMQENQKQLSEKIRELNFQKSALDEHAIVSIADIKGNITYVNDKFCKVSGYSREELIGQNHRLVKSGDHSPEFYKNVWQTISSGKPWNGEIKNLKKGGDDYWVDATIVPFLSEQGKPFQYIAIRTDITELKEAEFRILKAKEYAEKANQAKSKFLSSMSHELRTPMNAILGFSQLIQYDNNLSDENKENVQEILNAGEHLLELINQVLNLEKVESGYIDLSLEPVELSPIIDECISLVSTMADKRGIHISHSSLKGLAVRADRTLLRQVLLNLLSNAIKYNREGGTVKLEVKSEGTDRLRILVIDTGKGISTKHLAELFLPFNRLGEENSLIEGTGIGLTITRRIIDMMGGIIDVKSEASVGSTFWFELTAESMPELSQDKNEIATGSTIPPLGTAQRTVLYIEDNPSDIKLVVNLLSQRKHIHLLTAHTQELGIELAMQYQPELILFDINMPGIDNYKVLEILKTETNLNGIPVVALTTNAISSDIERGMAAGFSDYLTKPLAGVQFDEVIDKFLNTKHITIT